MSAINALIEKQRLDDDATRKANWKRWGPYLSERQWATVREDYSPNGDCWDYFPHDNARSQAYRWGEDGLLGITDRECRLCFALALWNGQDPILKERLFGLTNPQGNHGEDVKEYYYYIDSTPTHSSMKALYKYPQARFPYEQLVDENHKRTRKDREYELADTGIFADNRYFDVQAEYAKAGPNDILIEISVTNRGPVAAELHLLPTLWFRNTWSWGCTHEGCWAKPRILATPDGAIRTEHVTLEPFRMAAAPASDGTNYEWLFTDNVTNSQLLYNVPNECRYVKDAFHHYVVHGEKEAVNPRQFGTKAAAYYHLKIPAGGTTTVRLRLFAPSVAAESTPVQSASAPATDVSQTTSQTNSVQSPFSDFETLLHDRRDEANAYYAEQLPEKNDEDRKIARTALAGLLWSKQFYHYVVNDWLDGDPNFPSPPAERQHGRNSDWRHLFNRDIVAVPDKWEYPWYAAWDLAFHMVTFATVDPEFAKDQLRLFLREWYMHPNGQIPAYEFDLSDVNPPVHAWACWQVYKRSGPPGKRDWRFLSSVFQKLLINFTWWVNRKDLQGNHLFSGGFLGLDNIGVFDRSRPLARGGILEQADGTAWMAFYCSTMLSMALELAQYDGGMEDIASKFFEHFVSIADAMNTLGGTGLWAEDDGFYYDQMRVDGQRIPLRLRSIVGLVPLLAVEALPDSLIAELPGFQKRLAWFLKHRRDLANHISYMEADCQGPIGQARLLALPAKARLERVLRYMLDENEFLSPYGIRSLSKQYEHEPFNFRCDGQENIVRYVSGESDSGIFGGNSNWRGPVWFPLNFLIIEALGRYYQYYGDALKVECPTGSGRWMNLNEVAIELSERLVSLFRVDPKTGRRPYENGTSVGSDDPLLFFEYFDGNDGRGCGASHQTGWTSMVVNCLEKLREQGNSSD